ncbi:hypothetical protein MUG78_17860 [Gordonia alkaliphila]|uniref:hypothetical protein n=1 Tax=Gordonia alkaliphila TaxID=1053547 RepID=UPI001FF607D3|nr:hypothetical protein [Gordonia alkaliphila]MCK0441268.1 hypothetical protein [Gordonia alkaliphila]
MSRDRFRDEYADLLTALDEAGVDAFLTDVGGGGLAVEVTVPDTANAVGHYVWISDGDGPLKPRSEQTGWSVGRYEDGGEVVNRNFEIDSDALATTTSVEVAAAVAMVKEALSW